VQRASTELVRNRDTLPACQLRSSFKTVGDWLIFAESSEQKCACPLLRDGFETASKSSLPLRLLPQPGHWTLIGMAAPHGESPHLGWKPT